MNELGNKLRELRGARTLREMDKTTGLAMRTYWRAEKGTQIRIETLNIIREKLLISDKDWPSYLIAWIKSTIGPDNWAFLDVRPQKGGAPANTTAEHIKRKINDLSASDQQWLLTMLETDATLGAVRPICELAVRAAPKSRSHSIKHQ